MRDKPKKAQSVDFGLTGGPEGEEEEKKAPVGASAPMSELASVLKMGIVTPLKPRVGVPFDNTSECTLSTTLSYSPSSLPHLTRLKAVHQLHHGRVSPQRNPPHHRWPRRAHPVALNPSQDRG